jgi:hypothetical protein
MFSRGTAAEISVRYNYITWLDGFHEIEVDIFHAVFSQQRRLGDIQVAGGDNGIRVYIHSIFMDFTF